MSNCSGFVPEMERKTASFVMGLHLVFIPFCHTFFFFISFAFSSFISFILWRTIRGDESFFSIGVYIRNASSNQSPQFSDRHLNMQKVELRFYFFFVWFFLFFSRLSSSSFSLRVLFIKFSSHFIVIFFPSIFPNIYFHRMLRYMAFQFSACLQTQWIKNHPFWLLLKIHFMFLSMCSVYLLEFSLHLIMHV